MQSPAFPAESPGGSPFGGAPPLPAAFQFRPRGRGGGGSVDWRRLGALDVERVAREADVAALQEHVASVTFCDLGGEACGRCGQPVDPALLKVLRLAQLTIEYLLHCQDCLAAGLARLEARLRLSLDGQRQSRRELGHRALELKGLRQESRRRRQTIAALQQLLLHSGAHGYHPCHLCDKTFMSAAFLRGHLQRRHAGHAEDGDGGGKPQQQQQQEQQELEAALEELRAQLKCTQGQLEAQQAADRQRQLQEVESMRQREMEAKKEFDEWKERERSKFYGEIDKLKQLFWDEFKVVANQNSTLEEKLQALQARGAVESHLGSLRDEEAEERLRQAQELQALREKMELQKTQWKRKMKQLDQERAAERRELQEENERLRASLSQDERKMDAQAQRQLRALRAQLQEQARRIASQEDMIQALSARKVEEAQAVPQPVDVDVDDSSEEEPDDAREDRRKVLEALRQNATLLKQFRPILEDTLQEKLEGLGIKRDARGISTDTLGRLEGLLRARREGKARTVAGFLPLRAELAREATSRATAGAPQPHGQPPVTRQPRTPTPRRTRRPESHRAEPPSSVHAPPPAPRPRARAPPAPPGPGLSTPPFSSEEEEEEGGATPPRRPQPDLDWSDTDFSEEEEDGRGPGRGSGGLASSGTLVQAMVRNLQKQLEAPARKPAGGVSVLGGPGPGPRRGGPALAPTPAHAPATAPAMPGGRPQLSEESELEISSLEDLSPSPGGKQPPTPSAAARPAPPGRLGRPSFPAW